MSEQTTYRTRHGKDRPYFALRQETAQDKTISFEARGMLAYLLSKPDNWKVHLTDLMRNGNIGRDQAKRILKELKDAKYIVAEKQKKNLDGTFASIEYRIYEEPHTENPSTENQSTLDNTDSPSTESTKEKDTIPKGITPTVEKVADLKQQEAEIKEIDSSKNKPDEQSDTSPTKPPGDPVFGAIAEWVFDITDCSVLTTNQKSRIGGMAKDTKDAMLACMGFLHTDTLIRVIRSHSKECRSEGYRPNQGREEYNLKIKAFMQQHRDGILQTHANLTRPDPSEQTIKPAFIPQTRENMDKLWQQMREAIK
jgi:hypothetical protein